MEHRGPSRRRAVGVGGFALTAAVLLGACGSSDAQRDDAGAVVRAGNEGVYDLRVGDCLDGDVGEDVTKVPLVPCEQEHTHEVYALVEHPDGAYPGAGELETFAEMKCVGQFADYIGVELSESTLYFTYLFPSVGTWNEEEDREIVCFAVARDQKLVGTVKSSGI